MSVKKKSLILYYYHRQLKCQLISMLFLLLFHPTTFLDIATKHPSTDALKKNKRRRIPSRNTRPDSLQQINSTTTTDNLSNYQAPFSGPNDTAGLGSDILIADVKNVVHENFAVNEELKVSCCN